MNEEEKINFEQALFGIDTAILAGFIILAFTAYKISGKIGANFNYWELGHLVILLLLLHIIFSKRSRVASTLLFLYYLRSDNLEPDSSSGKWFLLLSLIILYMLFEGVRGTFVVHRILKQSKDKDLS